MTNMMNRIKNNAFKLSHAIDEELGMALKGSVVKLEFYVDK